MFNSIMSRVYQSQGGMPCGMQGRKEEAGPASGQGPQVDEVD